MGNNSRISFVNVFETDYIDKIREWRNQDFVRNNMTNQSIISYEEHKHYMEELAVDDSRKMFIAMKDGTPFAVLNFIINDSEKYIEPGMYIIDESMMGKGLGMVLSYARLEYTFKKMPDGVLRTVILKSNERNQKLQMKYGGEIKETVTVVDSEGNSRDAVVIEITRSAWNNKKQEIEKDIQVRLGDITIGNIEVEM